MDSGDEGVMDIEGMLQHVGDFGRYQLALMALFSIINVLSAFHYFGQTFISVTPEHRCRLGVAAGAAVVAQRCFEEGPGGRRTPCASGWAFNATNGFVSAVQEMEWVCGDAWKPAFGQSMFFAGSVAGSLALGALADHVGRLHALVAANLLALAGNLLTAASADAATFAAGRFVAGCATDSNFVMMYIIVMEYIRPSMRTFGLNLCIGVFYCLSCVAVPWVAVALGRWRLFLTTVAAPHAGVLLFYLLVPESAQWLVSRGRVAEAMQCFRRIAVANGRTMAPAAEAALRGYCARHAAPGGQGESVLRLFASPRLRRNTLILIFKSMAMTLCYDAISRNVNGLGYSPFVVFSLTSATILPACVLILLVQDRVGRKALASGALLLSGVFTVGSGVAQWLMPALHGAAVVALAIVARLGINVAYNSGAQYAVELIPTVVRAQGVSTIHVVGYAATFFSPQILYLGSMWQPAPDIILGILLMLGAGACLFLPETLNKTLPITLKDGEEFGQDEKIFDFACCRTTKSESTLKLTSQLEINKYT